MRRTIVIGGLIAALLLAQLEDLATAGHMLDRLGSVAERGPLVAPAYDVFGLTGLIALKIGLFALIVGTAALLIRVGRPILVSLAVALLAAGAAAGVLGAATNLHAVGLV